jgi:hypothetical protein
VLRDFCVIQWCFVVLSGEFATDIPRAWLLKINDFQISKFPTFPSLRASNKVVGSAIPDPLNRRYSKHLGIEVGLGRAFTVRRQLAAYHPRCTSIAQHDVKASNA